MNGLLCVTAIAAFLVAPNLAIDCSHNRCATRGATHTMCMYPDPIPASDCGKVTSIEFTEAEKMEIIHKHNELRQFVADGKEKRGRPGPQPEAFHMKIVSWDDELAELAQRWANQCNFGHDECRDVSRFAVGQNAGITMTSGDQHTKPSDIIMMWYNEVKDMNRNLVKKLTIHVMIANRTVNNVGHYTQMVWGDTEMVGCGKIVYTSGGWNRYYMVCNYGPAGNWMGEPVYEASN